MIKFENDWDEILADEFNKDYYQELRGFLKKEYSNYVVYPGMFDIFNAFKYTPYHKVKAVILGQDPYHEPNQAHGLAFSVMPGTPFPPSLQNIFKELRDDLGYEIPQSGCLEKWAKEGVLLLNTALTVRAHQANSHRGKGWEIFTDNILSLLNKREDPIVFILWGANARAKKALIDTSKHKIIEAVHPSPLSAHRGFFGGKYFSKTNEFLKEPIDWSL